ncbi:hypothetical protein XENOCAPTIV_029153 [Xenoophorus captivus]|uniref:Uncharacterized protein n=1 Tax=Xenoophorus captivus TaxID=1517983 RepID=A0ABV0S0K5_9TELE
MNYILGPAQRIPRQTGEFAQLSSNTFFNELQTLAAEFSREPEETRGSPVVPGVNWVSLKVIIKPGTQVHRPVPSPGNNISCGLSEEKEKSGIIGASLHQLRSLQSHTEVL